ncbi:hypothetical protein K492DRAFT_178273 [Lichtheimia hyalospora FSU 10163]|nr:hypothetical protein K492DRAFT_178273 [Lichtheimia hyalospora FSU 10163]
MTAALDSIPLDDNPSTARSRNRAPSLSTACPPAGVARPVTSGNRVTHVGADPLHNASQLCKRLFRLRITRLLAWGYLAISMIVFTLHLPSLTSKYNQQQHSVSSSKPGLKTTALLQNVNSQTLISSSSHASTSPIDELSYPLRLSKMFSKSMGRMDHLRPHWFSAIVDPDPQSLTVATVLTMDEWPYLIRLAEQWNGPISAALQIPTDGTNLGSGTMLQHLSSIRRHYDTNPALARNVDLHLIARPTSGNDGRIRTGQQDARNLARLFARSRYVAHIPVTTLWMTDLTAATSTYLDRLDAGDLLIVPTFAFPKTSSRKIATIAVGMEEEYHWPTTKAEMVEWVDDDRMGILDYHWNLNKGPTSYTLWREAAEPYLLPTYDYHYSPVYIATRDDHPWCEERFMDEPSACLYSTYLNGANFWVLPNDYIVRTGQEPENKLTKDERILQVKLYKNYRIEQCVFYARQFDQVGTFSTKQSDHVQQECAKELGSLRRQKMISSSKSHH